MKAAINIHLVKGNNEAFPECQVVDNIGNTEPYARIKLSEDMIIFAEIEQLEKLAAAINGAIDKYHKKQGETQ